MKKIAIFVDLSNLYLTVAKNFTTDKRPKPKIDFRKYYHYFDDYGEVSVAIAYGAILKGANIQKFLAHLHKTGFRYKYKEIKEYQNHDSFKRKADQDVNITIDAIRCLKDYDVFILGSGDGDFCPLVEYLREQGKQVFIFASEISGELKQKADLFFDITADLLEEKDIIIPNLV